MSDLDHSLQQRIIRLIQERGWNQEDFARAAGLNRQTIHQILSGNNQRRLRNATVLACANALGLSVNDLRTAPIERLLPRVNGPTTHSAPDKARLYDLATQPELVAWMEENPDQAKDLAPEEVDELLSLQGTGGPLSRLGVEHFAGLIRRKRKLLHKVHAVAGTEYLGLLEQFVDLLFEKVQPYHDRM